MDNIEQNKIDSYLTFKLGEEEYATHVGNVLNILEMTSITKVPKSPEYMKGVINLRGMVLPVIDTRTKFGMPETEYTDKTCIVVMDLELDGDLVHVGTLVDQVVAVLEIDEKQIEDPPGIGSTYQSEFISGVARVDDHFIMILDMINIFSTSEITNLKEKTNEAVEKKVNTEAEAVD
jgi:purine-binding chemotaxis protein CheW